MRKKHIYFVIIAAFLFFFSICSKSYGADLDKILNYEVVVEPRMNDGSLDITYNIKWKVLDSSTEGPLEWVQIGTPNSFFDNATALTSNIKSITPYSGSYVKIVFNRKYFEGETITFKYRIHQSYMYKLSFGKCKYSFTPAWFTDINIDKLTVKWNKGSVKSSNATTEENNYLVWTKTNMVKGEKLEINVKYDKSAFGNLDSNKQRGSTNQYMWLFVFLIIISVALRIALSMFGGGYYGHGGFYGGHYGGHFGGCVSSCACACARSSCASSCACACAGSGRAGCSRKDFYGTKINNSKLRKVIDSDK